MATRKSKKTEVISEPQKIDNPVELKQYDIDWAKLAQNVQEAAELAKTMPKTEPKKVSKKK
jgi:hypothetical protein